MTTLKLRHGSYCLLIDLQGKMIIAENTGAIIGGGIEDGETVIQACIREVQEETNGQIIINKSKLKFFKEVIYYSERRPDFDWDGKNMQIFVYLIDQSDFVDFEYYNVEKGGTDKIAWMSFDNFFEGNKRIERSELEEFLNQNPN
ncbi:MAG: NUDIX hydrolase [Candidatus Parcubacteria bacterium]|nr:NUDIX hydrolase [Candidatus Paceibacterota bacterium]